MNARNYFVQVGTAAAALMLAAGTAVAGNLIEFRTIFLSGQQAPGAEPGVVFRPEEVGYYGTINNAGEVAFFASLTGAGVTADNDSGIWRDDGNGTSLFVRRGQAAPQIGAGVSFRTVRLPILNQAGRIAFEAFVTGPGVTSGVNSEAIWSDRSGVLAVALRAGDEAPGIPPTDVAPPAVFSQFDGFAFNDSGRIAVRAKVSGFGVTTYRDEGIWSEGFGSLRLVTREHDALPNDPVREFETFTDPAINSAGAIAFGAQGTQSTGFDAGFFTDRTGTLLGETVSTYDIRCVMNAAGDIALPYGYGEYAPGFGGTSVFRSSVGGPAGNPAPASHFVVRVHNVGGPHLAINGSGHVAYVGSAFEGGPQPLSTLSALPVVVTDVTGTPTVIAAAGDPFPGAQPGQYFNSFSSPCVNDAGQVVFSSGLRGPGITVGENSVAIWLFAEGELQMLLRWGDLFDVNDDPQIEDWRTISDFRLLFSSGGEDGRASSFNDRGELLLSMGFTDGSSGLFVIAVPAPGSAVALLLPAAVLASRRRRTV